MNSVKDILSPLKTYNFAKETHLKNVEEYFSKLVKDSNTNLEENKNTCSSYYAKLVEIENLSKSENKTKKKKGFFKFLMILCFILIILIPVGILIKNKIKNEIDKQISDLQEQINKKNKEVTDLKNEAINQSSALNSLYDWNIAGTLFSETIPLIQMDKNFNVKRYFYLHDKYGFKEHEEDNISTVFVQSGSILGNPFVIEKNYVVDMMPHTYTGTLVIHWVTYQHTDKGTRTIHHSQTLIAHTIKPAPMYYLDTWLIYGNEAAPKLSFYRKPSNANSMNEKQLDRLNKKFEKKLEKKSEKDLNFTKMANTKFESLFNATNRDNEVEFRLLFTSLAQQNMVDLITCKEPYGDDFYFYKRNCLNYIKTNHSQGFDYSSNPNLFIDFDLEKAKEKFINYNNEYFDHLYFDFAPLLSIPLYQNYKSPEYIYKDNHGSEFTGFEIESLANAFNSEFFKPSDSVTDLILKAKYHGKNGDNEEYYITAHSYRKIPHVELVPTLGGDGHMHAVPVTWFEYIPVVSTTPLLVKSTNENRYEFNKRNQNIFGNDLVYNIYYQKGLVAGLIKK